MRDHARLHGHLILRVYHEIPISGRSEVERRTALPQLLAEVRDRRRDFDGVIVWKLDRLCRNPAEHHRILAVLDKHRCAILSVKDPPIGRDSASDRLISGVLADFAAYEREITGERIYAHHLSRFMSGLYTGAPAPLGLAWDKQRGVFRATDRAADVVRVFEVFVECAGSAARAAARLNEIGIASPRSGLWSGSVLLGSLRQAAYRRRLQFDGRRADAPDLIPEIVPPALVAAADLFLDAGRRLSVRDSARRSPYSGLVCCSLCGERMTFSRSCTRDRRYPRWQCRMRRQFGVCAGKGLSDRYLDQMAGMAARRLLDALETQLVDPSGAGPPDTEDPGRASSVRRSLADQLERTKRLYVLGIIEESELAARVADLERRIADAPPDSPARRLPDVLSPDRLADAIARVESAWPRVPEDEKRGLLLQLQCHLTVNTSADLPLWLTLRSPYIAEPVTVRALPDWRRPLKFLDD